MTTELPERIWAFTVQVPVDHHTSEVAVHAEIYPFEDGAEYIRADTVNEEVRELVAFIDRVALVAQAGSNEQPTTHDYFIELLQDIAKGARTTLEKHRLKPEGQRGVE